MRRILGSISLAGMLFATGAHAEPSSASPLRLYLTCPDYACDFDFLKREIAWVDWVRDRADADVVVLLSQRTTGGGGTEDTFSVFRPHGGGPAADTLRVFAPPAASDDENRRLIANTVRAVVARDLAERPEGSRLRVSIEAPKASAPAAPAVDRWNHWVYKLSTSSYVNGESSYRSGYLYSSLSASRITATNRIGVGLSQNYNESRYTFGDGSKYRSISRSWSARTLLAHSLSKHLSAGVSLTNYTSTYSNIRQAYGIGPAIEWSVYPYEESSRRAITIGWQPYVRHSDYEAVTLFGKTRETLPSHELDLGVSETQTWGSVSAQLSGNQYLHDTSKYRLNLYASTSLKLVRGLSIDVNGNLAQIHDQIGLPRGDASDSEVLVRQRQLATNYSYYVSVGLSYRFGSIFDNVVNTRLENTLGSF